jgi:hypothetical protein
MNPRHNPATGKPYTLDEINDRERDRRTPQERARDEARANARNVLDGAARYVRELERHPCPDPIAVRVAAKRLAEAAEPFGGIEAARKAGLIPGPTLAEVLS